VGAEDFGTVSGVFFRQGKLGSERGENIATACVPDPSGDIFFLQSRALKNGSGVLGGEGWNFGSQEITQEALAVIES
jgi:hypothetical protein